MHAQEELHADTSIMDRRLIITHMKAKPTIPNPHLTPSRKCPILPPWVFPPWRYHIVCRMGGSHQPTSHILPTSHIIIDKITSREMHKEQEKEKQGSVNTLQMETAFTQTADSDMMKIMLEDRENETAKLNAMTG